jgi:chromosome segregation ATPase
VADEPSNGELARRLDDIARLLQGLVSRAEYTADQRHVERRFTEMEHDIAEKRRVHEQDIRDLREENKDLRTEIKGLRTELAAANSNNGTNFRQAIYSGAVPGIIFLLGIIVTIFLAFKGGK